MKEANSEGTLFMYGFAIFLLWVAIMTLMVMSVDNEHQVKMAEKGLCYQKLEGLSTYAPCKYENRNETTK